MRVILAALLLAISSRAAAQAELRTELEYRTPDGCPSAEQFWERVVAREASALRRSADGRVFMVTIDQTTGGFHARLAVSELGGAQSERELDTRTCDEAVSALALVTALAIHEQFEEAEERDESVELAPSPPPPAVDAAPVARDPPPAREPDPAEDVVTSADAVVALYTDEDGTEYLILSAFSETSDGAGGWWQNNVAIFVLSSDFAPGATVALDGIDRVAVFAAGPSSAPEPTIFAAAITGTVDFGAGSASVGDRMNASLTADFAPAMPTAPPAPPGVPLVAGGYNLVIDPTPDVICGGTMTGLEATFAGETLALVGTTDGPVSLALPTADTLEMTGTAVGGGWGAPFILDAVVHPPDTFVGSISFAGSGPSGSELAGAYWLVEGMPATPDLVHGAIGLAYVDPVADGGCDVVFYAELHRM